VRKSFDIGAKSPFSINGRDRISDGLTEYSLSEVKNVNRQSFTRQLRDYSDYAQDTGRRFDLYVRPDTKLSGPLQDAISSGRINLRAIPKQ
jgi:Restriction endonuclease fold toxin 7